MTVLGIVPAEVAAQVQHRATSLGWILLVLAGAAVTLAAMHAASSVVVPIYVALVLALVLAPLHGALKRRGLAPAVSLLLVLLGVLVSCVLLGLFLAYSFASLGAQLREYAADWSAKLAQVEGSLAGAGVASVGLSGLVSPDATAAVFAALIAGLLSFAGSFVVILMLIAFFLAEGAALVGRLRSALGEGHLGVVRLTTYGHDVARYFALRALVNAVTGAGVTLVLFVLGVDFPVLWGVVTFFLSFIPYVGMFIASVPSVLLALAEFDVARALLVIVALTVVNATAENIVQPALMSRGLQLSPTFVFISLMFWSWLLGGAGSFLAIPLSLVVVAILASFTASRWLASVVTVESGATTHPEGEQDRVGA